MPNFKNNRQTCLSYTQKSKELNNKSRKFVCEFLAFFMRKNAKKVIRNATAY